MTFLNNQQHGQKYDCEKSILSERSAYSYESLSSKLVTKESCDDHGGNSENNYLAYTQRWLVLGSFALLSMSSSWIWITWSPISINVATYWNVPVADVDNLMGIYMYIYVPFSFVSLYLVVNYLGLKLGLTIAGVLNASGAILRYRGVENYNTVYFGTVLCALAQTFTLSTPPLISTRWFPSTERGTATSLGILANQFGTAVGLGITTIINIGTNDVSSDSLNFTILQRYLAVQAIFAIAALVLIILFCAEAPPTPPSRAAAQHSKNNNNQNETRSENNFLIEHETKPERIQDDFVVASQEMTKGNSPSYYESIQSLFCDRDCRSFLICFGTSIGVFYTIPALLSQITPSQWSSKWDGWIGIMYQLAGVFASFGAGRLMDAAQDQYHKISIILLLLSLISLLILLFSLLLLHQWTIPTFLTNIGIVAGVIGTGTSLAAFNTVGIEYGTGLAFPADETAVAGVLEASAELFGFVWVTVGGLLIDSSHVKRVVMILAVAICVSLERIWNMNGQIKRPR
jgi:Major Facilitator Superfamily